jgi:hypothetical protein
LDATATVTGRLDEVPPLPIVAVTPEPLKVTTVAPVKFAPLMVAGTVVPCALDDGLIPEIAGSAVTVNPLKGLEVPAGVVTVNV